MSNTTRILRFAVPCLLLIGAAACGFKGPLYLPDATPEPAAKEALAETESAAGDETGSDGKEREDDRS